MNGKILKAMALILKLCPIGADISTEIPKICFNAYGAAGLSVLIWLDGNCNMPPDMAFSTSLGHEEETLDALIATLESLIIAKEMKS